MGTISINGTSYNGKNITVRDNKVIIDGKEVTPKDTLNVNIVVEGDVERVSVDNANEVRINGNTGLVSTMSGDVLIKGDVNGSVKTMSGDVSCSKVQGNVSTMSGDINKKLTQ